jgi:hypothetical protein
MFTQFRRDNIHNYLLQTKPIQSIFKPLKVLQASEYFFGEIFVHDFALLQAQQQVSMSKQIVILNIIDSTKKNLLLQVKTNNWFGGIRINSVRQRQYVVQRQNQILTTA